MNSKANQIYLKQTKIIQDVMSIHYQKIKLQKNIHLTIILAGLNVFSPFGFILVTNLVRNRSHI
jgi:hypothetical protein